MKKILIGTHNKGKFREIASLLPKKYKKISPLTLNIPSPKETGKTFSSNSKLKANFFSKFTNYPVISDDSGLCVKSMNNKPGIYSARLAKKFGSFSKAMDYILKKIQKKRNRNATFICSLTFKFPKKKPVTAIGKINGQISQKKVGINGFGYDPIFLPKNKKITFGQMKKNQKMKIDHRSIAFKKLKKKIKIL